MLLFNKQVFEKNIKIVHPPKKKSLDMEHLEAVI